MLAWVLPLALVLGLTLVSALVLALVLALILVPVWRLTFRPKPGVALVDPALHLPCLLRQPLKMVDHLHPDLELPEPPH
ncbi:hypothetical protein F5141DRAFT_1086818 [Pisolithus sp. B1]|nr:hypothetical protein F5141DRAFT_1086818 [Pisolithus sp. B1]